MKYYVSPMGYDELGERLHALDDVPDIFRYWPSESMATNAASQLIEIMPECVLVRVYYGDKLIKEVKR